MSLKECFQLCKDAGFDGVEVNYAEEGDLSPAASDADIKAGGANAADIGIQISGLAIRNLNQATQRIALRSSPRRSTCGAVAEPLQCRRDCARAGDGVGFVRPAAAPWITGSENSSCSCGCAPPPLGLNAGSGRSAAGPPAGSRRSAARRSCPPAAPGSAGRNASGGGRRPG